MRGDINSGRNGSIQSEDIALSFDVEDESWRLGSLGQSAGLRLTWSGLLEEVIVQVQTIPCLVGIIEFLTNHLAFLACYLRDQVANLVLILASRII